MRVLFKGIVFASALLMGGIIFMGFTDAEKRGTVTYTDGQVRRQPTDVENWEDAPVNTEVLSGDKVRTYRQSRAELDLAQLDLIRLAPRTIIDIIKLYTETKEKKVQTEISLEQGEIWASVHEVETTTEFDVSAPIAAAAITGTLFRMRVEDDSTTQLKVYKGEVRITNAPQRTDLQPRSLVPHEVPGPREVPGPHEVSLDEWMYIIKAMQQITIDPRGKVVSSGGFSTEDRDEKTDWVKWNQQRDIHRLEQIRQLRKNR
jgi:hypothetical protein